MTEKLNYPTLERILKKYCHETRDDIGKAGDYHKISDSRFDTDFLLAPAMTEEQQVGLLYNMEKTDPDIRSEIDGGRVITLHKSTLARYRNGQQTLSPAILGCFSKDKDDLVERFEDVFFEHIIAGLSEPDQDRLINEIVEIIDAELKGGSLLELRQQYLLDLAKRETASLFLAEVYVYAIRRYADGFDEFDNSEFMGIKHSIYRPAVNACPVDSGVYNAPFELFSETTVFSEELKQLRVGFQKGRYAQVICGEPGIGKTELAYRFSCDIALDRRKTVIWIDAGSIAEVYFSLRHFLLEMNLATDALNKNTYSDASVVNRFRRWLEGNAHWLVIIDNLDESDPEVAAFRRKLPAPSKNRWYLITQSADGDGNDCLKLERRSDKQALDYLQYRFGNKYQISFFNAEEMLLFSGLPLALELSAGYAGVTGDYERDDIGSIYLRKASVSNKAVITHEEYDTAGNPEENFLDHVGYSVCARDINDELDRMSGTELVRMAFDAVWDLLEEQEQFLLRLIARMPGGEIDAYLLEDTFYGNEYYDFFISRFPADVWKLAISKDHFAETIRDLANAGICRISFYRKDDLRQQNHFGGLRKIRLHETIRSCINEQEGYPVSQQRALEEILTRIADY